MQDLFSFFLSLVPFIGEAIRFYNNYNLERLLYFISSLVFEFITVFSVMKKYISTKGNSDHPNASSIAGFSLGIWFFGLIVTYILIQKFGFSI